MIWFLTAFGAQIVTLTPFIVTPDYSESLARKKPLWVHRIAIHIAVIVQANINEQTTTACRSTVFNEVIYDPFQFFSGVNGFVSRVVLNPVAIADWDPKHRLVYPLALLIHLGGIVMDRVEVCLWFLKAELGFCDTSCQSGLWRLHVKLVVRVRGCVVSKLL